MRRSMAALMGLAVAAVLLQGAEPARAATTYEVKVGPSLKVPGVELTAFNAFLPNRLRIRSGDTIHFTSDMFHTVTLLPAGQDPDPWLQENAAPQGDGRYSFLTPDPDEGEDMWKASTPAAFPSRFDCGGAGQPPCEFTGEGMSGGWTLDPVLNSGIPAAGPLDFSVTIDAEPGTTVWALCLVHPIRMKMPIEVVEEEPVSDQEAIDRAVEATLAQAKKTASALDKTFSNKRISRPASGGGRIWDAWAGIDRGPLSLYDLYPQSLSIRRGDGIRWHFPASAGTEDHTVSGPMDLALEVANSFPELVCDVDTDSGPLPDIPTLPPPAFCPGFVYQLEVDLPAGFVPESGEGIYRDEELVSSGLRGSNMLSQSPWEVEFPVGTGSDEIEMICIVHPFMRASIKVR